MTQFSVICAFHVTWVSGISLADPWLDKDHGVGGETGGGETCFSEGRFNDCSDNFLVG